MMMRGFPAEISDLRVRWTECLPVFAPLLLLGHFAFSSTSRKSKICSAEVVRVSRPTCTRKPPFPLQKTTPSNPKTIRLPLENHHFDSKITLRRSKILLSRPQNTTPQTENTPNPADFSGKTLRLYILTHRRLKKTMTPDRLPT